MRTHYRSLEGKSKYTSSSTKSTSCVCGTTHCELLQQCPPTPSLFFRGWFSCLICPTDKHLTSVTLCLCWYCLLMLSLLEEVTNLQTKFIWKFDRKQQQNSWVQSCWSHLLDVKVPELHSCSETQVICSCNKRWHITSPYALVASVSFPPIFLCSSHFFLSPPTSSFVVFHVWAFKLLRSVALLDLCISLSPQRRWLLIRAAWDIRRLLSWCPAPGSRQQYLSFSTACSTPPHFSSPPATHIF